MSSKTRIVKMHYPNYPPCPSRIIGTLEISKNRHGILIIGDPKGLRSLAKLLVWLADVDQETHPNMPDGDREHVHLHPAVKKGPFAHLTQFSTLTELCRLDAKGTGDLPPRYGKKAKRPAVSKKKRTGKDGKH
jgi:hypothetical protein